MGIVSFLTVRLVEVAVVLLLIVFMPSVPPKVNFTYYKVTPSQNLEGKFALNTRLNNVERLFENELKGPEAFAEYNGELYTSLFSGEVVKLSKGQIVHVTKFGKPCSGFAEESICGRPLGLKFDRNGNLYVADAYYGIWKVDIKTGKKTQLVSMDQEIEGKKPKIPNSIAVSENGDIYWSDSSTDFSLEDGVITLLADGTGRVIHYDSKTKTNKVLVDGLVFANGIILSPGEEFLLISETSRSCVHRYYLKGPKKGTLDIFLEGIPGLPDNLSSDGKDGFFVPLVLTRDPDHPLITQIIAPFPLLRKLAARILALTELGFKTLHRIYPNVYTQEAIHWVGHFESMSFLYPRRVTVLHVSKTGEILNCLHSTDGSVSGVSEAFIFGSDLYLGSPFNHYLGRIPLSKVELEHLARQKREIPAQKVPPVKEAQAAPPKPAPTKQTPPPKPAPTPAPTKATPAPTQAPVKQTQPPKAAPTPSPASKTAQQAPSTPPQKRAEKPPAPKPNAAPLKAGEEAQKAAPKPTQGTPPPPKEAAGQKTPSAGQKAPPTAQKAPPAAQKEPVAQKEAQKQAKQNAPTAAPVKETPPAGGNMPKDTPKVVPVKENTEPKTESVKPRK